MVVEAEVSRICFISLPQPHMTTVPTLEMNKPDGVVPIKTGQP
jgi:hypothetical protein